MPTELPKRRSPVAERAEEATAAGDLQRLEAQAVRFVDVDPGLAALLAVEANRISGGSPSSADALQRVLSGTGGVEVRFPGVYGESRLSRDGATLVAFELRHVDVWDLPTRTLLHREEVTDGGGTLTSFDITADARLVAYANLNGTHLLEVATGVLTSVSDAVTAAIAFTSDGRELAVASGNAVEFWDVTSPSSPRLVDRRTFGVSPVSHIDWNPTDDGYALVKDATQEIEYWHRNDAEPAWTYSPTLGGNGRAGIPATLFSSDGASLIVANGEQKGSGAVVRKYATSDGAPYATSGGEEIPPAASTPASLNDLVWSDEPNGLVVGTLLPTGVFALDLSSGTAISPPFEAPNAAWIGYSSALQRYVTSGLQGIEIRRRGSGPLERVVTLTPEQQVALDDGGAMYASISADANTAIAAVFHIPRHPQTVAFDLTTDPPVPREMGEQLLPVAVGDYTLMASPTTATATGEIVLLDADLEPVGAPIETPTCTRMWKPSPDGRFFAVYCEYGAVNLYRSSGELVKAGLVVPDATPAWEQVRFSFTSDGSRMFGYVHLGELQWAIWDTETGSLLDHGTRDELQRPIVVDDTLYVQRGVADFSLLQLDPDTFEPVGPPLVESLFTISEIAGDGRGELVAVTGLDGVTHVFDTATGSQLGREISGNRNPNASFAADGTTLLVQSDDQVSVWNYDRTSWPDIACTLAGRNLTRDEWEEWGPRTIEYRPTCPQFPADAAA